MGQIADSLVELNSLLRALVEQMGRTAAAQEENAKSRLAQAEALASVRPPRYDFEAQRKRSDERLEASMKRSEQFQQEQRCFWAALLTELQRQSAALERNNELIAGTGRHSRST